MTDVNWLLFYGFSRKMLRNENSETIMETSRYIVNISMVKPVGETNEVDMETSEMVVQTVQTKYKDEGDNMGDTNIKKDSENHGTEVELINPTQTPDHDDQNGCDWDPLGTVCGPHSNCPCSVHRKHDVSDAVSDSEDLPMTNPTDNVIDEVDNTETQWKDTGSVALEPPGRYRQNKGSNGDISNSTLVQNKGSNGDISNSTLVQNGNNEDNSKSLLHTPYVELFDQSHRVQLYAEDKGPHFYRMRENLVTPPIITTNLTEAYKFLPIFGTPENINDVQQFQNAKVTEFVGCGLSDADDEFTNIAQFGRTGSKLKISANYSIHEPLPEFVAKSQKISELSENLCIVKKLKTRIEKGLRYVYMRKLKYRGVTMLPMPQSKDCKILFPPLEPGKDLVYRVRVYRPYYCSGNGKDRQYTRHSVFSNDIVLLGRQKLTALRDRLACPNDLGMRTDTSHNPDDQPAASAKDIFPSGFLFINNAFYVDTRDGCKDHSAPIRQWARDRGMGDFPCHDMTQFSLEQLHVRLGHPEVYLHQGNCEHLFTFSEVRLLNASDPLQQSLYPFHTAVSMLQTIYCTTCSEFGARWIVTGCSRVPFDASFFCEACFKQCLYKDGKRIDDFQAFCYRGNEINILKPTG